MLQTPDDASACLVLAHGAGAGMNHWFMAAVADGLAERGIATLRFQFPYMESGSKRPDRPALAHATIRAAVAAAALSGLPLFAGGKSFGGRMTSQAQAEAPLPDVLGLVFLGFPLHPANKPSTERARPSGGCAHSDAVRAGTRDALADMTLLSPIVETLGATLHRSRAPIIPFMFRHDWARPTRRCLIRHSITWWSGCRRFEIRRRVMSDQPAYDSRADILAHIIQVRDRLDVFATELSRRGTLHDASKFSDAEKPAFDLVMPLLPGVTYGSPEYLALEDRVRPALDHHYRHNSHHPEHYGDSWDCRDGLVRPR